jgi:hypothetical protein
MKPNEIVKRKKGQPQFDATKTTMDFAHKLIHATHQLRMQIPTIDKLHNMGAQGTTTLLITLTIAHKIQSNKNFQLPEQFIQHSSPSTPQQH